VKTVPFTTDSSLRPLRAVDEPRLWPSHHKFKSGEKKPAASEAFELRQQRWRPTRDVYARELKPMSNPLDAER